MSDQDVFNNENGENNTTPLNNENQEQGSSVEDLLKSITRPDGSQKYPDVETALKALSSSQEHIANLELERSNERKKLEELEAKISKVDNIEQSVDELLSKIQQRQETPAAVDPDEIANLVKKTIEQDKQMSARVSNRQEVSKTLQERFGDKTAEVVEAMAKENGLTREELGTLSETKPKLVLALFNKTTNSQSSTTPPSHHSIAPKAQEDELKRPEKSLLSGATTQDQVEYLKKIREKVYKQYNVET